jgi:hypothetical protein
MVRLISVILLLAMLPRMLLAMPDGNIVCFADDHVAVACHEPVSGSACDESASPRPSKVPAPDPSDNDACVDVAAVSIDASSTQSATGVELAKFLTTLLPALIGVLVPAAATPVAAATFDELPHSFCARTFCCSIALRC